MIGAPAFDGLPDPGAYVPRIATDRCLAELEHWAFDSVGGPAIAVLAGPPGIGKTLMLRMLETRARGRLECVYVANPTFGPRELCISALDALGIAPGEDPRATFERTVADLQREGSRVLLLIDDVELLHTSTEDWLRRAALEHKRSLLVVFSVADSAHAARLLAVFGGDARHVSLTEPMGRKETAAFVYAELARRSVPYSLVVHFDERAIDAIHASTGGIPGQVQDESATWLRRCQDEMGGESRPRTLGAAIVSVGEGVPGLGAEPPEPEVVAVDPASRTAPPEALPSVGEALALLAGATGRLLASASADGAAAIRALLSALRRRSDEAVKRWGPAFDSHSLRAGAAVAVGFVVAFALGHLTAGPDPTETSAPITAAASHAEPSPPPAVASVAPVGPVAEVPPPRVETPPPARPEVVTPAPPIRETASPPPAPRRKVAAVAPAAPAAVARARARPVAAPRSRESARVEAAPPPETLLVDVNARPWAVIWIDGREIGETPLAEIPLAPGPHRIAAELPDGRRIEREEQIGPDNRHLRFE